MGRHWLGGGCSAEIQMNGHLLWRSGEIAVESSYASPICETCRPACSIQRTRSLQKCWEKASEQTTLTSIDAQTGNPNCARSFCSCQNGYKWNEHFGYKFFFLTYFFVLLLSVNLLKMDLLLFHFSHFCVFLLIQFFLPVFFGTCLLCNVFVLSLFLLPA